jgi:hypothetical protein
VVQAVTVDLGVEVELLVPLVVPALQVLLDRRGLLLEPLALPEGLVLLETYLMVIQVQLM